MTRNCGGIKRISNVAPGVKVNSLYDDMMPRAKVEDVGCLEIAWKEICNHTKGAGGGADQSRREKVLHNGCNIFIFPLMTRNCGGIKRISNVAPGVKVN